MKQDGEGPAYIWGRSNSLADTFTTISIFHRLQHHFHRGRFQPLFRTFPKTLTDLHHLLTLCRILHSSPPAKTTSAPPHRLRLPFCHYFALPAHSDKEIPGQARNDETKARNNAFCLPILAKTTPAPPHCLRMPFCHHSYLPASREDYVSISTSFSRAKSTAW